MGSIRCLVTLAQWVALPPKTIVQSGHSTKIDFAKNQLSPSLISLSPLIESHLSLLQQTWVRSSDMFYHIVPLLSIRSLGFGSFPWYKRLLKLAFASLTFNRLSSIIKKLADSLCKRYAIPKYLSWYNCSWISCFKFYFTPLSRCSFQLSFTVQ